MSLTVWQLFFFDERWGFLRMALLSTAWGGLLAATLNEMMSILLSPFKRKVMWVRGIQRCMGARQLPVATDTQKCHLCTQRENYHTALLQSICVGRSVCDAWVLFTLLREYHPVVLAIVGVHPGLQLGRGLWRRGGL